MDCPNRTINHPITRLPDHQIPDHQMIELRLGTRGSQLALWQAHTVASRLAAARGRSPSIGTGSVRRIAQVTRLFPAAHFAPIRGNLDTRLRKLDEGGYDALVLAAAGLRRLGFASRISLALPAAACVPAPGQGIVAL